MLEALIEFGDDFPTGRVNWKHLIAPQIRESEKALGGRGRVFVRYSGTENKLRVMVEGQSESKIKELAEGIAQAVKQEIGA